MERPYREEKSIIIAYQKYEATCKKYEELLSDAIEADFTLSYRPDDACVVIEWGDGEVAPLCNVMHLIRRHETVTMSDLEDKSI